jgi:hypothetical protein
MMPVSFCNGVPREHPSDHPDSRWASSKPPSHQTAPSLAGDDRPSFIRSGVIGSFEHVDPRHGDRSPRRIYPNLTDPNTPCRKLVPPSTGKRARATILRCGSLSDEPTRRVGTNPPHLLGPLNEAPRERRPRRAASGVPSTPRPAWPCGQPVGRLLADESTTRLPGAFSIEGKSST